jgi:hypothetical protein
MRMTRPQFLRPRPLAAVAAWLAVVSVTSAVAWLAIDHAGREVVSSPSVGLDRVTGALQPVPAPVPGGPGTPGAPTRTGPTRTGSTPAGPGRHRGRPGPTARPEPGGSSTDGSTTGARIDRTVSVQGGQVVVRCQGTAISLRLAQPANGWQVQTHDLGPDHIEVSFGSRSGQGEIDVRARCQDGVPVFDEGGD